ncbi:DUF4920 domain-containing protein [Flavobacterium sp.]|jgi:hypothetical protein|uniref:DUF4920 domain-containing protein n=1 Tax=Flavobacterium sp. TaxID=239 RepID=UPI0037C15034
MKRSLLILTVFLFAISCNKKESKTASKSVYAFFGKKITEENTISKEILLEKYKSLKKGDTLAVKVSSKINEICQNKGCWMTLDLGSGKTAFVKFKDYGFFVPMNAQKRNTIIEGKAFVEETSVAELKHYAEDEGKSPKEIAAITEPKTEYKFLAHGVLISK